MSFRCRSFLPHQIVVDILVVGISEGFVRHMVLEHISDALSCLASCLVVDLRSSSSLQCITKQVLALLLLRSSVVEEAVDVGVTVKILCLIDPQKIRVTGDAYNWKQKFQKPKTKTSA